MTIWRGVSPAGTCLDRRGFQAGDTLIGSSAAGAIAADIAALWPDWSAAVAVAPSGFTDMAQPTRDLFTVWARRRLASFCENRKAYSISCSRPTAKTSTHVDCCHPRP